jgi:hypothetical protein
MNHPSLETKALEVTEESGQLWEIDWDEEDKGNDFLSEIKSELGK